MRPDDGSFILFMGWLNPPTDIGGEVGRIRVDEELRFLWTRQRPFWTGIRGPGQSLLPVGSPLRAERLAYVVWLDYQLGCRQREMLHVIKQAASVDGVSWRRGVAVKYAVNDAQAFSRPTVLIDRTGRHQMWYSYRGRPGVAYRIGYAESDDGVSWIREMRMPDRCIGERVGF